MSDRKSQESGVSNEEQYVNDSEYAHCCVTYGSNPFVSAEIPLAFAHTFLFLSHTRHFAAPLASAFLGVLLMFQDKYQIQTTMQISLPLSFSLPLSLSVFCR